MRGGNNMVIILFSGGILLGFLVGFSTMAMLSAIHQRRELQKIPVYERLTPPES
jgi:NhaP-type Na+/H+ or K+/H+ antiporter